MVAGDLGLVHAVVLPLVPPAGLWAERAVVSPVHVEAPDVQRDPVGRPPHHLSLGLGLGVVVPPGEPRAKRKVGEERGGPGQLQELAPKRRVPAPAPTRLGHDKQVVVGRIGPGVVPGGGNVSADRGCRRACVRAYGDDA